MRKIKVNGVFILNKVMNVFSYNINDTKLGF